MVILCDKFKEELPSDILSQFVNKSITLSDFQKWALKAVIEGDNVLITAHTGSGKTLPAEFAIQYMVKILKKKVIYTTPIKALSNQKLFDFRRKFPDISFGILTGDCKDNPEADVLIMTTEILRNTLFNRKLQKSNNNNNNNNNNTDVFPSLSFDMDFDSELGAVVFDEVHYINDADRGSVWEQSIILLPPNVQLVLLSATIDRAEMFAEWIEGEKCKQLLEYSKDDTYQDSSIKYKKMYLATTHERVVPLTHYMWLSFQSNLIHMAKKFPSYEDKFNNFHKTPIVIADSSGNFNDLNYYKTNDLLNFIQTKSPHTRI